MKIFSHVMSLGLIILLYSANSWEITDKNAVVTLVTGDEGGYSAGAVALGQSLIDVGSKLRRIVMVTPEVSEPIRKSMSNLWEVREVEPIACQHKLDPAFSGDAYDLKGEKYQAGLARWKNTCTKFAAWKLYDLDRVVFIDADCLAVGPIDDALYGYSNASFLAAPEVFPPDTFNSGFIVLNPGVKEFNRLLEANRKVGSAEGGDQGVFNNGVCPNWFLAPPDDPLCGRLPWLFNVEVAHYVAYNTLRKMSGLREPSVVHFVSDGKPWTVLYFEYISREDQMKIPFSTRLDIGKQALIHMKWRKAYFSGSKNGQPKFDFLLKCAELSELNPIELQQVQAQESKLLTPSEKPSTPSSHSRKIKESTTKKKKSSKKKEKKSKISQLSKSKPARQDVLSKKKKKK